jgi:hypothetical protein
MNTVGRAVSSVKEGPAHRRQKIIIVVIFFLVCGGQGGGSLKNQTRPPCLPGCQVTREVGTNVPIRGLEITISSGQRRN